MTKKDYIKLAKAISDCTAVPNDTEQRGIQHNRYISKLHFLDKLCNILAEDNPRFDSTRFIKACND